MIISKRAIRAAALLSLLSGVDAAKNKKKKKKNKNKTDPSKENKIEYMMMPPNGAQSLSVLTLNAGSTFSVESNLSDDVVLVSVESKADIKEVVDKTGGKFEEVTAVHALGWEDAVQPLSNMTMTEVHRFLAEEEPYGLGMVQANDIEMVKSANMKICVIDTGYSLGHEDLPNTGNMPGLNGFDQYGQQWDVDNGSGHGTHCAGTIGAIGGNDKGVNSCNPDPDTFTFHIGKGLTDSGSGSTAGVVAAVNNCVENGAKVISMSLGGGSAGTVSQQTYEDAYDSGVLIIAAAGNGGNNAYLYPASYLPVMSVAAVNSGETKAGFSQYNDQVEISGPGVGVLSTYPTAKRASGYASLSGTSMATPHVAGIAAKVWSHFPDCENNQIRNVLLKSAKTNGRECNDQYGYGIVQAKAAYDMLAEEGCEAGGPYANGQPLSSMATGGCGQVSGTQPPTSAPTDFNCDDTVMTLKLLTDNYGGETSWKVTNADGEELHNVPGDTYESSTQYDIDLCLSNDNGCMTFTISDAYSDGICCSYGQGNYELLWDGEVVGSGGDFDGSESVEFNCDVDETTEEPTFEPTFDPTSDPTFEPTFEPTNTPPTSTPTFEPTSEPTFEATDEPTVSPVTDEPTTTPTTRAPVTQRSGDMCIHHGFDLNFDDYCNYDTVLEKFIEFFDNPANTPDNCPHGAEEEFELLLGGGNSEELHEKVRVLCKELVDNYESLDMEDVARAGPDFLREYFDGNTIWNEEHETHYPKDDRNRPTNVLRTRGNEDNRIVGDAAHVQNVYEGEAQYGVIDWPGHLSNFDLSTCTTSAAMCCWPSDRQANDNNGNCATPYDAKCEDSDPSDNTDLCYVDLEKGQLSTGYTGSGKMVFEGDDGNNQYNAEGPIHCHGLAWANDDSDFTSSYKGNNLFYVAMYDHMSQRGYVRNIQGAPMCGCTEQMPIVRRSDCTQVDVEESYEVHYDGFSFSGKLEKVHIDFNACQGFDRNGNDDNNDLWSYMNRLYREEKVTEDQLFEIGKVLVGEHPNLCQDAINEKNLIDGLTTGYNEDTQTWVKVVGKDALHMDDPFSGESFDYIFSQSPNKIIMRICISCVESHQKIYYKRISDVPEDESFNHLKYLTSYNFIHVQHYVYGEDFEIYSTYEDALNGDNEWNCETYRYDRYFPGDCGPNGGYVGNVGSRFDPPGGRGSVAFYVEKVPGRSLDVNNVPSTNIGGSAGTVRTIGDTIYMTGGGGDIWNHNHVFNFYQEPKSGGLTISVNFTQFDYSRDWSKAGLMIRESLDPSAKYVSLHLTGLNGVSVQWRSEPNTSNNHHHTLYYHGPTDNAVLKLERSGNKFTSYYLDNTEAISTVVLEAEAGKTCEPEYADLTQQECWRVKDSVGASGSSLYRGSWTHVPFGCFMNAPQGQIHYAYNQRAVNNGNYVSICKEKDAETSSLSVNTVTCRFALDDITMSVYYNGVDITDTVEGNLNQWNAAKTVEFVAVADATLVVYGREANLNSNNNCQASGFLMECTATDGNSAWNGLTTGSEGWRAYGVDGPVTDSSILAGENYADDFSSSICTSTSGFYLSGGSSSTRKIWAAGAADFAAFAMNPDDTDVGEQWVFIRDLDIDMSDSVFAGLAVSSGNDRLAEATFEDYNVEQFFFPSASPSLSLAPTTILPSRDIGNYGLEGSSRMASEGTYILRGSGRDIWDRDDGFHALFYKQDNNDFTITAHIDSFDYAGEEWAKTGVMARFFLCNKSPHVFMGLLGRHGFQMIWRTCMDCSSQSIGHENNVRYTQGWVKLVKVGDEYSGYAKHNESDEWNLINTVTISDRHEPDLNVGMVVSARDNNKIATATFSDYILE